MLPRWRTPLAWKNLTHHRLQLGVALGAVLQGIRVEGRHYAGGWWDWLSAFSVLTGLALVAGYAALGAGAIQVEFGHPQTELGATGDGY